MSCTLSIPALNSFFEARGLGFLSTVADILIAFACAALAAAIVMHSLRIVLKARAKNMDPERFKRLETAFTLIASFCRYVFYFIAVAVSVGTLGLSAAMNSMLAAAGIGGIIVGVGAQSIIKDIATGISLLFDGALIVGDYVTIGGVTGTIESVTLRSTSVRGPRGELTLVPNGQITTVVNHSRPSYLAMIDVGIDYGSDVRRAMALMKEEGEGYFAENGTLALDKPDVLGVAELGDSAVTLRMTVPVKPADQYIVERLLRLRIKERFDREGIVIPYPHLTLVSEQPDKK